MSEADHASHQDFPVPKTSSIVAHEESASGSQQPQRVNTEIHDLFDGFMKGELKEGTLDSEETVIETAIPEIGVPFDADEIYERLLDEDGVPFYDAFLNRWHGFPGHNNPRQSIPRYVDRLAHAVHNIVKEGALLCSPSYNWQA